LIDDDRQGSETLAKFLREKLLHEVTVETSCDRALELFYEKSYPLIISDIKMPGMDGLAFLKEVKSKAGAANTEVILITGHGKLEDSIEALRAGAFDYLLKPIDIRELVQVIKRVEEKKVELSVENPVMETQVEKRIELQANSCFLTLAGIGKIGIFSQEMRKIKDFAIKLYDHREIPVMIEGETGTGKEIIARMIHYKGGLSEEHKQPFISLNCSAISASLFESELFGYERGAFTGADPKGKAGKLELAEGGTLFLDEIGDMPLEFQPKLLRVLQEREFFRISGSKKVKLDVRVICATNNNLQGMVESNNFRRDLYYRLNTARIQIPALRERKRDIVPLAQMFMASMREKQPDKFRLITEEGKEILESLKWEGNVRELRSVIERIFLQYNDRMLRGSYIESVIDEKTDKFSNVFHLKLPETEMSLDEIEKLIVSRVMKLHNHNITQAAGYLKISRNRLKRLMNK
jgi:DNA-binding NtrC family response regulator